MTRLTLLLTGALLATACARSEPADPTPGEDLQSDNLAVPEVAEPSTEDPLTPGRWEAGAQGAAQSVAFRSPDGELLLSIGCDTRAGLVIQRPGVVTRGNIALMQLRTADVVRRLAVNTATEGQPQVEARVAYNDQLIPALLSFEDQFEVHYEGMDTLTLPPSPLVGNLVRICQGTNEAEAGTGPASQLDSAPAAGNAAEPAE